MSTPGPAKPQIARYKKTVCFGLNNQTINFASAAALGHRVQVSIPVNLMNEYFRWTRVRNAKSPFGKFVNQPPTPSGGSAPQAFEGALADAFNGDYTDLDGVAKGLNFSSSALDMDNDVKRASGNSANDLVMAYVMFKCFGASAYDPTDVIYNLDDAFGMLSSSELAGAIEDSLTSNVNEVDALFRAFLAADPMRYFVGGKQIQGLFEVSAEAEPLASGAPPAADLSGNWCLTVGDRIEIPLQLVFRGDVNVLSVQDNVSNPSSSTPDSAYTTIIEGDSTYAAGGQATGSQKKGCTIAIRLQIVCSAPQVSAANNTNSTAGNPTMDLDAQTANPIFYTDSRFAQQTAIVAMASGGTGPYTYTLADTTSTINLAADIAGLSCSNGVLTYTPPVDGAPLDARAGTQVNVAVKIVDAASPQGTVTKTIKVTFDAGVRDA